LPTVLDQNYQFDLKESFSEHFLEASTGDKVHYMKFSKPLSNVVILYFHGNAGALDSWSYFAQKLSKRLNAEVWIMDYPGFGKSSEGIAKSGSDLVEIGRELLNKVREVNQGRKIVLFGRSLGSGVVSEIAATEAVDAVILETPFYSIRVRAEELFPLLPTFILKYDLDNSKLRNSSIENILVLYGEQDKMIPVSHPERLQKIYSGNSKFIKIKEGGHNGLPMFDEYWKGLNQFVEAL